MEHLYRRSTPETLTETIKQVSRLATVDMRRLFSTGAW